MSILDIVIGIIFLISLIIGLLRGFVREVLSIVTWVASIWLGIQFYAIAGQYFRGILNNEILRDAAGFVVVFFGSLIVLSIISFLINKIVAKSGIKGTDRVLGSVFGLIRGVLVIALLVVVARSISLQNTDMWQSSQLIGFFEPTADALNAVLPERLRLDERLADAAGQPTENTGNTDDRLAAPGLSDLKNQLKQLQDLQQSSN